MLIVVLRTFCDNIGFHGGFYVAFMCVVMFGVILGFMLRSCWFINGGSFGYYDGVLSGVFFGVMLGVLVCVYSVGFSCWVSQ